MDRRFDADGEGFPLDVTWLDIEYAEEHRYFDWDEGKFPDVKGMLGKVEEKGRKVRSSSVQTSRVFVFVSSFPFSFRFCSTRADPSLFRLRSPRRW